MRRRQVLAAAAVGTAGLLAGCSDDGGDGEPTEEPLQGQWELRATVVNEDDVPREWRVECRSRDRASVAAAYGTLPPGETTELSLLGQLFDEQREVSLDADSGEQTEPWRPTECRQLYLEGSIADGRPAFATQCREE